jgi:serine/threonine protein kinase
MSSTTGTTAYWPPERFIKREWIPTKAGDMWAVGVILFIMLTGVHPFDLSGVANDAEIAERIKTNPSPPITPRLTGHLSPAAINLIEKLFMKDPSERITADQMLQHPWITGDEATTEVMLESAQKLSRFKGI